jgi:hypothetical protein
MTRIEFDEIEDLERILVTRKAFKMIVEKMEQADEELFKDSREAGYNPFVEFAREHFGQFMAKKAITDDIMLEPTPRTTACDLRDDVPETVIVNSVEFSRAQVETAIRFSNPHLI